MRAAGPPGRAPGAAALLALAASGHVLYPLWLALPRVRVMPEAPDADAPLPGLSVVVPAYRERSVIETKVADLRGNGYEGPLEIVVVADDEETAAAARRTGARVVAPETRQGKAAALNLGIAECSHPIVVMTDANTWLEPGSLEALARWFAHPEVGAVAGEKQVASSSQGLYWRFESWLKRRESRAGTTIGLVGEVGAVRRSAFRPLPADLAVDDMWLALDVIDRGLRVVYEPRAVAYEQESPGWREEWERRTRVGAGVLDNAWRRRSLLLPGSGIAAQLWGHRVVRYSVSPIAHAALLLQAVAGARRSRLATAFLLGHVAAGALALRHARGDASSAPARLAYQVLVLQLVGFGGLVRYLRGSRPALWPKPERSGDALAAQGARPEPGPRRRPGTTS